MRYLLLFVYLMCFIGIPDLKADDDADIFNPSLKGLKVLHVSVNRVSDTEDDQVISSESIQTEVEVKLRIAGLPLTNAIDILERDGAFLNIDFTLVRAFRDDSSYAFHIELRVSQLARLERNRSIVVPLAVTWSESATGFVGRDRLSAIRDKLDQLIARFMNAYLSENPKKNT